MRETYVHVRRDLHAHYQIGKRVLSTTTTSALYTAAQQTADWGALLATGDTLDIRIYQLSALVGRGAPKTVALTF